MYALLKKAGEKDVLVGLPKDSPNYPNGETLPDVAYVNENGIGVPARPFLAKAFQLRLDKYRKLLKEANRKIFEGKDSDTVLGLVGEEGLKDVVQQIDDTYDPPNSPTTIARKGSSHPLIDTGHMRQQITYRVRPKK